MLFSKKPHEATLPSLLIFILFPKERSVRCKPIAFPLKRSSGIQAHHFFCGPLWDQQYHFHFCFEQIHVNQGPLHSHFLILSLVRRMIQTFPNGCAHKKYIHLAPAFQSVLYFAHMNYDLIQCTVSIGKNRNFKKRSISGIFI